jgi:Polyketide cyclase / dehydrase and lipid transport
MGGDTVAIDVRRTVLVRRPRSAVASFMFDPANDLRWTGGITSSRPAQPGPLVRGATVARTAKFLGRTFDYGYVVTQHDPGRLVELKVDRPFPMLVRYELSDADDGTLVAIRASGEPGGFFRWAAPVMARQVRESIAADLERLRTCLESAS